MPTADWSQIDSSAVTIQSAMSTSDLFGGELFGDELMDMYNSAAVVESSSGTEPTTESIAAEIPTLLPTTTTPASMITEPPATESNGESPKPPDLSSAADGAASAVGDDGLGAFRPSTSFNDLTRLLPSQDELPVVQDNVVSSEDKPESSPTKKRGRPEEDSSQEITTSVSLEVKHDSAVDPVAAVSSAKVAGALPAQKKRIAAPTAGAAAAPTPVAGGQGKQHNAMRVCKLPITKGIAHGVSPRLDTVKGKRDKKMRTSIAKPTTETPASLSVKVKVEPTAPSAAAAAVPSGPMAPLPCASSSGGVAHAVSVKQTPRARCGTTTDSITLDAAKAAKAAAAAVASASSNPLPMVVTSIGVASASAMSPPPAPAPSAPAPATTEESFKGVAQAAVTNLILTAGATAKNKSAVLAPVTDDDSDSTGKAIDVDGDRPINTSSSHIAALTSSNWVAACSASVAGAAPGTVTAAQAAALAAAAAASDPAAAKANRARRANLSPDERARQNRDRNREHARNTRLRKKAYVEELKRTLTELVAQRDATDLERRHEAQRDLEVREVRFRVMEEFLKLRSRGDEGNGLLVRWVAILEEGFTLTLPSTPYRKMVRNGAPKSKQGATPDGEQILDGATEALEDALHISSFLNSIIKPKTSASVRYGYVCDRKKFLMDGCNAVLDWTATTSGLVAQGGRSELFLKGSLRATFSPASNKLVSAEMMFDTGRITSQLELLMPPSPVASPAISASMPLVAQQIPSPSTISLAPETCDAVAAAAAAAAAAANEADALLDSLQMPQLAAVSMLPSIPIASVDEKPLSSEGSNAPVAAEASNKNSEAK